MNRGLSTVRSGAHLHWLNVSKRSFKRTLSKQSLSPMKYHKAKNLKAVLTVGDVYLCEACNEYNEISRDYNEGDQFQCSFCGEMLTATDTDNCDGDDSGKELYHYDTDND